MHFHLLHVHSGTCRGADAGISRGGVVWHDDGTVKDEAANEHAMYQRGTDNAALNYEEASQAASRESAQAAQPQLPTPSTAAISTQDEASLNAAIAVALAEDSPEPQGAAIPDPDAAAPAAQQPRTTNGTASQGVFTGTALDHSASDHAPPEYKATAAMPTGNNSVDDAPAGDTSQAQADPAALSAPGSDSGQPLPASASEAAAAVRHITQAFEPVFSAHATETAADAAKASDAQAGAKDASAAQAAADDNEHKAGAAPSDTPMPDGNTDTALKSTATVQQPDGPTGSDIASTGVAVKEAMQGTSKGPGLGDSREFAGGPVNVERQKFRQAPYGPPAVRLGGRFSADRGRSSPQGRSSPTGRSFGRGFVEPPRLVKMHICHALGLKGSATFATWGVVTINCGGLKCAASDTGWRTLAAVVIICLECCGSCSCAICDICLGRKHGCLLLES